MLIVYMLKNLGYGANNLGDVNASKGAKYGHGLFILHTVQSVQRKKQKLLRKNDKTFLQILYCALCAVRPNTALIN
jgi:hypothetical protein